MIDKNAAQKNGMNQNSMSSPKVKHEYLTIEGLYMNIDSFRIFMLFTIFTWKQAVFFIKSL